jgi:hypothetical protein
MSNMRDHLKTGLCYKCNTLNEVWKMEEVELESPNVQVTKEYMLCRDCFRKSLCRVLIPEKVGA